MTGGEWNMPFPHNINSFLYQKCSFRRLCYHTYFKPNDYCQGHIFST
uniref:Alternative protein POLR3F n=1 Tax=Homo sapiens TaxID=9606 RepID=L8EAI3_HUMAN|nr:alternative protein POLR3F [Homo sapiens]